MNRLSSSDRLVLLALQAHAPCLTEDQLQMITHLPTEIVQESILTLEALNRARSGVDRGETYQVAIPLSDRPLLPLWEAWLAFYFEAQPPYAEGDTLATMYDQCGVILLTAIVSGTRDPDLISCVTSLPLPFTMLVLGMADRRNIWDLDSTFELQRRLTTTNIDLHEVDNCLDWLKEELWEFCWTPKIEAKLHEFRAGHQFGGKVDWWLDSETLDSVGSPTIH